MVTYNIKKNNMGNSISECIDKQRVNKGEFDVTANDEKVSDEYLKKTTPDNTLSQLLSRKIKEEQQPRRYMKGSVKVIIL
ncbi:hypothetical protein SteCoe_3256 [Stentor coeruleus]|uniref:Uncharacterized protein n=1 Tax=Stentor coeruleus TaxID=5963 RepID=A0A1R2CXG7_9CILI|nr:hypothetical protein SteCoe_3256 [Stentor coeruleus]